VISKAVVLRPPDLPPAGWAMACPLRRMADNSGSGLASV